MKKSAIAWAALKAVLLSTAATVVVGFLFAGISEFGAWAFEAGCRDNWTFTCDAFSFWTAWWWFIFILLVYPLWMAIFILLIRKFAAPGCRLVAIGYVCIFQGALTLLVVISYFLGADIESTRNTALLSLADGIVMLSIGLALNFKYGKVS